MSDSTIDRIFDDHAARWLADGPTQLPAGAMAAMRRRIDGVPQERPRLPWARLSSASPRRLVAAAALVVALTTTSILGLRTVIDGIAGPQPGDLLFSLDGASTLLERDGGPDPAAVSVTIDRLPQRPSLIVAGSCTGGSEMTIRVFDTSIIYGDPEDGAPIEPEPQATLAVPCDDLPHHRMTSGDGTLELVVAVPAGATWRIAVGEFREMRAEPDFAGVTTPDGWVVVLDQEPVLVTSGAGLGPQVPEGAATIAIVISCSGDPLTILPDPAVAEPTTVTCDDPTNSSRIEYPASGLLAMTITATTAGVTWLDWQAEASNDGAIARPPAPPLPAAVADVGYADADGDYIVFGSLGSNTQTQIRARGARAGHVSGDLVGIVTASEDGGQRLELWSIADVAAVRELATVGPGNSILASWIDTTHALLYFGVSHADGSATWHRIGLDGSAETEIAAAPAGITSADAILGLDDAMFVVDFCTQDACTRMIDDPATVGPPTMIDLGLDRTCEFVGAVAGSVVAWSAPDCQVGTRTVTIQPQAGGRRTVLADDALSAVLVSGDDGPSLVYLVGGTAASELFSIDLAGAEQRSLATFDHPEVPSLSLSPVVIPGGEWVLVAGPLADTPNYAGVSRAVPRLIHISTGEQIDLVNLPSSTD